MRLIIELEPGTYLAEGDADLLNPPTTSKIIETKRWLVLFVSPESPKTFRVAQQFDEPGHAEAFVREWAQENRGVVALRMSNASFLHLWVENGLDVQFD